MFDMVATVKRSLEAMECPSVETSVHGPPLEREYSEGDVIGHHHAVSPFETDLPSHCAAWKLYIAGRYGEALSTLHPLLQHTSLPPHTTSITRLLAAGCYTNLVTVYPNLETYCKS